MRTSQQLADGIVGEVMFPNTIPPFFPSFVLSAPPPKNDEYEHRLAGIRAHNRWLADFCADYPAQRAGIGQIFTHNLEDAMADVRWVAEHGLRGGILIPNNPPDATWVEHQLYDPYWDPLWALCADLGVPVNAHGGTGVPNFGKVPAAQLLFIAEFAYFAQRPFLHLLMSGVFERHPNLTFVMTEMGAYWLPPLLRRLDLSIARIRDTGSTGELRYGDESILPKVASEYFQSNCYVGISSPKAPDVEAMLEVGLDRFMWGSDYPHDEGTQPFTQRTPAAAVRRLARGPHAAVPRRQCGRPSTASTSTRWHRSLRSGVPRSTRSAKPLVDLPEDANEALVRGPVG